MVISSLSGTALLVLWARAARNRERKMQAGAQAMHVGAAIAAIAIWWGYTAGENEMGGARALVVVLLGFLLGAGLLQLKSYRDAHAEDEFGSKYAESGVPLMHIAGHTLLGLAAIAIVVIAAVRGVS